MDSVAIPRLLVSFINKLVSREEKNDHIGKDPVFTRSDPDVEGNFISDDEDEQIEMPEGMQGADRTPTRIHQWQRMCRGSI